MNKVLRIAHACIAAAVMAFGASEKAEAVSIFTSLNYNVSNDVLVGYSETVATYEDEGLYCLGYIWSWGEWSFDPPLCALYEFHVYYYEVSGQMDGPFGTVASNAAFNRPAAGISYSYNDPVAGTYTAWADHYLTDYVYYCELDLSWLPSLGYYCYPASWFSYFVGTTSAQAVVGPTCIHHGTHSNGSLTGAISLPSPGVRYWQWRSGDTQDTDDWGCDEYVHTKILYTGLTWNQEDITILDISLQNGGPFQGHAQHENGLDVDVRYLRTDNNVGAAYGLDFLQNPQDYDEVSTRALVDLFCSFGSTTIYVDPDADLTGHCVTIDNSPGRGHRHHFHVQFPDPDGTGN